MERWETYLVPQESIAVTSEDAGDPAVLVSVIPDGDTNALGHVETAADQVAKVRVLFGESRRVGWEGFVANIELGVCNFDAEISVGLEKVGKIRTAGSLVDDHVGLETDTVNLDATSLEVGDDCAGCSSFGTVVLH
jgi:hypothetical protein